MSTRNVVHRMQRVHTLQCLDFLNQFVCFLQVGDLQRSYTAAQKSEEAFPGHVDTQQLMKQLKEHFAML